MLNIMAKVVDIYHDERVNFMGFLLGFMGFVGLLMLLGGLGASKQGDDYGDNNASRIGCVIALIGLLVIVLSFWLSGIVHL